MDITIIAAIGANRELGYQNQLLWHLKGDMKFFREHTMGKPIVMGRKTFESLPGLLKGREHFVLTRQNILINGVSVFQNKEDLIQYLSNYYQEIMVIGGASIYKEFIDLASTMLLTEIHANSKADVFFPKFSFLEWNRRILSSVVDNNLAFDHVEYTRKLSKS
ncbi:MAG: dihydrofolate reductase [Bacilli bacterium]|nr:dihydrofolate reductase [Bacilli bacterium]